jgi:simple sugar transport system permease protein
MTVSFGWIQGWIVVKSGISSFIVTLGGLFFLRGLTEVSYRAFNRAPDQTAGSTTVTDLPGYQKYYKCTRSWGNGKRCG